MNFNKFTIKAQEAIQTAVNRVQSLGQQAIEPTHILSAILAVGEQVTSFLIKKTGANPQTIKELAEQAEKKLPKVSGGEPYLSRESNEVLNKAEETAKAMGDEYTSLEPLLLALLTVESPASKIMKEAGVNEKELKAAPVFSVYLN